VDRERALWRGDKGAIRVIRALARPGSTGQSVLRLAARTTPSRSTLLFNGDRAPRVEPMGSGSVQPVNVNIQDPTDLTDAEAASERARGSVRETSERLGEVYERTAAVFGKSAALAEEHARRHERAGRGKAAGDERHS
jgi:hypothetical protein